MSYEHRDNVVKFVSGATNPGRGNRLVKESFTGTQSLRWDSLPEKKPNLLKFNDIRFL